MTTTTQTSLRQARNFVNIIGYLKKKDLELKTNRNGIEMITGTLTVMTEEGSEHIVRIMKSRLKSDGQPNKTYPGFLTIMNEYVSMADLMDIGKSKEEAMAQCSIVDVKGNLTRNEYVSQQTDEFVSTPAVSCSSATRLAPGAKFTPKAIFELECYIKSIAPEFKNGEDTGRLVVSAIIPVYGGQVIPFECVVGAEVADDFQSCYEAGCTAMLNGDLINRVEVTSSRASGFGRQMDHNTFVREFLICGGLPPYDEGDAKVFSSEAIAAAMLVRENETIPAIRERNQQQATTSFSAQRPVSNPAIAQAVAGFTY